eukprot:9608745-Lingulodinium_polyedra.AAC.2
MAKTPTPAEIAVKNGVPRAQTTLALVKCCLRWLSPGFTTQRPERGQRNNTIGTVQRGRAEKRHKRVL